MGVKARKMASELEFYSAMFKFAHLANMAILGLLDVTVLLAYLILLCAAMVVAPVMADTKRSNVEELR